MRSDQAYPEPTQAGNGGEYRRRYKALSDKRRLWLCLWLCLSTITITIPAPANTSHPTRPRLHMHARRVQHRTSNRCPQSRHMLASAFVFPSHPATAVVPRLPAITRRTLFTTIGNESRNCSDLNRPYTASSFPRSTRFSSRFRSRFNGFILRLLAVSDNVRLSITTCILQPFDHRKTR
jgi:hypothetical protein